MTYKEHIAKALEKMPEGDWKRMLQVVYNHACGGGVSTQDSGGGGSGGNPPEPPK